MDCSDGVRGASDCVRFTSTTAAVGDIWGLGSAALSTVIVVVAVASSSGRNAELPRGRRVLRALY